MNVSSASPSLVPALAIPRATAPAAPSLWSATAPAALPTPPLCVPKTVDVLVIGAGYTGLSTALHLREQGTDVCVVDAHEPGWGASGRNGGQVNPSLKHDPDELVQQLGGERAEALIDAVSGSADLVFDLVARHGIDCHPVRKGWLQLAYGPKSVPALHARARQWQRRGVPVELLDRADIERRVGTRAFAGGWCDGRAGAIHPLAYARGLAAAAQRMGAAIHGNTAVTSLERHDGHWIATTASGARVTASHVVIATNGYSDGLWPGLRQTLLTANSFIVATRPLYGQAAQAILARGETVATSQRLLLYFRKDHTGRLLLGGRGAFPDPRARGDFAHLERSLALLFPQLGPLEFEYRWAGRIAVTRDFMPHVHEPAPGITIAVGCNGRGIALCTSFGRHIAERLTRETAEFPYPVSSLAPFPFHGLQRCYIGAGVAWYSLLDKLAR
ncbi:NAD(P)/FAD-dependent oxidoreductase [Cupriavidus plantarum]|uniref:Glycine/D-amino acid oxidase-like deaminating enzyme n=1 Tax=Cupriavidus plantarum TaxID=942865 RepID=A0A316F6Y0_9BURK|nr:FAD-binding oxidoreductase [Cupriavidus plantarum]NYI01499.1 glycine/D-amino acid oxidase-like deaminating enzyme [Cupriavidus plantarum]PWK32721.1 glycine/D-amino acid oxidase-like deaminating enzyme [Cupriavidus plantarum]REE90816.1 glycine/D-amino acid oxidase-like deaminating enzyme [Cupriavidus plantarum]RLK33487.1 glycine/D-amino acid oxidase-like deaminating enzyme [Cupriavidus plantarum]CAG2149064.1 Gamma-glutamylputrescine oxidoreductase [Cupriavidus plantarum]